MQNLSATSSNVCILINSRFLTRLRFLNTSIKKAKMDILIQRKFQQDVRPYILLAPASGHSAQCL